MTFSKRQTVTVLFVIDLWCAVLCKEYSRMIVFKEPVPNKALNGHVIRQEKVFDEGSCRVFCYLEPNCVSINVGPQEDGGRICELNSKTDDSLSHSAVLQKNRYTYFGIENPCHSNPCAGEGKSCQAGFTDKGFRCVCRETGEEENCKVCPPNWKSYGTSCYAVFATKLSWRDGEAHCNSMDARLVKITSENEVAFIRGDDLGANSQNTAYWIGLYEKEFNNHWKWSDGSELGVFTDWNLGEPNLASKACAVLFDGKWRDRGCSDEYELICEK
ncbi:C-type lectin domain family 4 member E-like [Stylophora pistillata]|uniref:C-type lectin domain family 4 member E-like n=1 Tax=Stylophora pistillata TaxID=50429 RepID=UPI000C044ED2|nr:C-type lectin domain family 4 member E-like [Stylophora pistillata]